MEPTATPSSREAETPAGAGRPDRLQWALIVAFLLVACSVVLRGSWIALSSDVTWSGSIAPANYGDTMQYLAFIRDSSSHVLAGNLFSLDSPVRAFLHPGIAVSGVLVRLGVPVPWAYALWVPVSAAALAGAVFLFVRALIPGGAARTAALALALFYSIPLEVTDRILGSSRGIGAVESSTAQLPWGYPYAAIAVALLCFALIRFSRARDRGGAIDFRLAGSALLVGWLQPWQGATLAATVVGVEALLSVRGRRGPSAVGSSGGQRLAAPSDPIVRLTLPVVAAALLPIAYYALLGRLDPSFRAADLNAALVDSTQTPLVLILPVVPLILPALLALRVPARRSIDLAARAWPAAALGGAVTLAVTGMGSSPSHFLRGIAIPLSVLAVVGVDRATAGRRSPTVAAIAMLGFLCLAGFGTARSLQGVERSFGTALGPGSASRYWLSAEEKGALALLTVRDLPPGGVVASPGVSPFAPWWSGRQVWQGNGIWTPRAVGRQWASGTLFAGRPCCERALLSMAPLRFASGTGADLALVACSPSSRAVARSLGSPAFRVAANGCSTLIRLPKAGHGDREALQAAYRG